MIIDKKRERKHVFFLFREEIILTLLGITSLILPHVAYASAQMNTIKKCNRYLCFISIFLKNVALTTRKAILISERLLLWYWYRFYCTALCRVSQVTVLLIVSRRKVTPFAEAFHIKQSPRFKLQV